MEKMEGKSAAYNALKDKVKRSEPLVKGLEALGEDEFCEHCVRSLSARIPVVHFPFTSESGRRWRAVGLGLLGLKVSTSYRQ